GAGGDRAVRRVLHFPEAVPERGLLHRVDLQGDGFPGQDVHGAVRARTVARMDRPVAGDDRRPGDPDRSAAADLRRTGAALLRAAGPARLTGPVDRYG